MREDINSIIIVGGGTSGWLSAAYLAKRLGTNRPDGVAITLIEASDIPTIGVGEGTFPSLRSTMATIGVDEADFMRESNSVFKQGIKFIDWQHAPVGNQHNHYYHLFNFPRKMGGGIDLTPYWLQGAAGQNKSFGAATTLQENICEHDLAPKRITDEPYSGPMNYAYHFDAGKLAEYLKKIAKQLGVKQIIGKVDGVELGGDGAITSLNVIDKGSYNAGLYIDCSGLFGVPISKAMGAKNRDLSDILFVDRALAIQVPNKDEQTSIESTTASTAQAAGWMWDIPLNDRRGMGYVYSSRHTDDTAAEAALRAYNGIAKGGPPMKLIKMPTGFCETPWIKNCVAVGLAGGFLEPLEATGIAMIEAGIQLIADYFPRDGNTDIVAKRYNKVMLQRYENAVEFIKMHYYLTKRTDTDFWIDNARAETAPAGLLEKLELWKTRVPQVSDFSSTYNMFMLESYQFVLLGMGYKPDLSGNMSSYPYMKQAKAEFEKIAMAAQRAGSAMPDHRGLIEKIYKTGFE